MIEGRFVPFCRDYEHSKFATKHVDFWRSCKMGRNDAKTAAHTLVINTRERECGCPRVLTQKSAKREQSQSLDARCSKRFAAHF